MIAMGILDPTKVTRLALQNAASVAGLMITTEVMVAEAPKRRARPSADGRRRHGRHGRHGYVRPLGFTVRTKGPGGDSRAFFFVAVIEAPCHLRHQSDEATEAAQSFRRLSRNVRTS